MVSAPISWTWTATPGLAGSSSGVSSAPPQADRDSASTAASSAARILFFVMYFLQIIVAGLYVPVWPELITP